MPSPIPFKPYPKALSHADGTTCVVRDALEEALKVNDGWSSGEDLSIDAPSPVSVSAFKRTKEKKA